MFQQINSRLTNGNRKIISDLKLPKQVIINNIKTTIPKVNNYLQKQKLSSIKKSTKVKMLADKKLNNKSTYYKRAGFTLIGSLAMFLLFDPMIQSGIICY